ncbi:MAG: ABC-F family ATP-binding cassette domain-containing protein [Oscillospiraceae bacterium]|nr:ABC-F family ATP-binding cassette domain-containing protein [Oscillospiraceae bacterium]
MILDVSSVAVAFGANEVLRDVSFQIHEKERVGLVGYNGCGKTTLLSVLTGELPASGGSFALKAKATLGYQRQMASLDTSKTVYAEMKSVNDADVLLARMKRLEATMGEDAALVREYEEVAAKYDAIDGYNLDFNIKKILNGMGFPKDTHEKRVGVLSGGERTRLALAKLLIMNPDLLILDEPTNHLDIDTLEWLESFLLSYGGAILAVSHDRHFLDAVPTKIVEIQNGKSRVYNGNFSDYLRLKEENDRREQTEYERTEQLAEKLSDYVDRNLVRASTSNMAKSRRKQLEKLDRTPPDSAAHVKIKLAIEASGEPYKEVLTATDLSVKAGARTLIEHLDMQVLRGERLSVIGANGTGKTTLLKTILGKQPPAAGRVRLGGGVKIGYLEQNLSATRSKNPLYYIWDLYPAMDQLSIRSLLATVGFRGEDVFNDAHGLSGGELARLNLARISLERPNLLVLDEPTNHLDIYTKDILYDALRDYAGTMLVVTHDRYLIECIGSRVLALESDGWHLFESYRQYRQWRETGEIPAAQPQKQEALPPADEQQTAANQKEQRRERAKERERKAALEKRIAELESDIFYMEEDIRKPEVTSDYVRLSELTQKLDAARDELSVLSDEWLEKFADE